MRDAVRLPICLPLRLVCIARFDSEQCAANRFDVSQPLPPVRRTRSRWRGASPVRHPFAAGAGRFTRFEERRRRLPLTEINREFACALIVGYVMDHSIVTRGGAHK